MKIGDKVRIPELKLEGRVLAIYEDSTDIQYNVRYFFNGEPKVTYFYPDEVQVQ